MYTNKEFILREIAGEFVLIPVGKASQTLNGMVHLTETASFIWKQVDTATNLQEIIHNLTNEYNVDEAVAKEDVYGFLRELYVRGMVCEIPELDAILNQDSGE